MQHSHDDVVSYMRQDNGLIERDSPEHSHVGMRELRLSTAKFGMRC